jgi:hypothetical protein
MKIVMGVLEMNTLTRIYLAFKPLKETVTFGSSVALDKEGDTVTVHWEYADGNLKWTLTPDGVVFEYVYCPMGVRRRKNIISDV